MLTVGALAEARGGAVAGVLGRGIAHLTIYLPALALYFIVLPRFYGFSTLGQPLQLLALASVFVLATSFMGQAVGAWFKRPETPTLIFLATSLPQFFLAGFSWPREAIPKPVLAASLRIPFRSGHRRHGPHRSAGREHYGRWRATGAASGPKPSSISRSLRFRRLSSSGGTCMASRGRRVVAFALILIAAGAGAYLLWRARRGRAYRRRRAHNPNPRRARSGWAARHDKGP